MRCCGLVAKLLLVEQGFSIGRLTVVIDVFVVRGSRDSTVRLSNLTEFIAGSRRHVSVLFVLVSRTETGRVGAAGV